MEELRRDLPNVRDRKDAEAEVMGHAAEPLKVIAVLEEQTMEAVHESLEAAANQKSDEAEDGA